MICSTDILVCVLNVAGASLLPSIEIISRDADTTFSTALIFTIQYILPLLMIQTIILPLHN